MQRDLEFQLEKCKTSLIKWKMRYRNLRRFLENAGVSPELFERYNSQLNDEFKCERESRTYNITDREKDK